VYEANQVRFNIYTADSNEDGQLKNVFPVPTSLIVVKNEIYDQNPRRGGGIGWCSGGDLRRGEGVTHSFKMGRVCDSLL